MVSVSPELKKAVMAAAEAAGVDMSKWARRVLAEASSYVMSAEEALALESRGRPVVYANDKERNRARARQQRERVAREQAVVTAVMRQNKLADAAELEAWLLARGVSLDDAQ